MAGEGYGTTSIGTGSAQVVGSPSFDLTKLAQPLIQQQKEKVAKEAQKVKQTNKILGDLKGLGKIGSLRYGAGIEKFKGGILEKTKKAIATQDVNDILDLENSKLQLNTLMDLAKKNDALNNSIGQQMLQGGNYWNKEYYDEYQKPLDISGIEKPEDLIGLMSKDADNMREIVKDKHNPMEFMTKMDGVAKTFYGTQGDFTEDDLKDSLTTLFTKDANSFDTYRHYEMAAKNDKALLEKNGGDVQKAALVLAFNDFKPLVGEKPKGKGSTFNFFAGGAGNTPNSASVFEANTIFGSGDNSFTQTGQDAAAYPVKKSVTSADPDSFNPVTMSKVGSGEIIPTEYGGMQIVDVLEKPLDLGGGIILPAGTPVPKDKSVADIAVLYFKNNPAAKNKVFGENADEAAIKSSPEFKRLQTINPQLGIRLFNVGVGTKGGKSISVYTPLEKNIGAIQGGMSKDDETKFNYQFDTIYKRYLDKGGKPLKIAGLTDRGTSTTGGTKTTKGGAKSTLFQMQPK